MEMTDGPVNNDTFVTTTGKYIYMPVCLFACLSYMPVPGSWWELLNSLFVQSLAPHHCLLYSLSFLPHIRTSTSTVMTSMPRGFKDLKAPSAAATIAEIDGVFGKSFPSLSLAANRLANNNDE